MYNVFVWFSAFAIMYKCCAREIRLGGQAKSNVNDPEIKEVTEKAMVELNKKISSRYLYKLIKIIDARTQLVSGTKYYLTILAAPTTCTKNARVNPANCAIDQSKPDELFNIEVWSAPWQNTFKVTIT